MIQTFDTDTILFGIIKGSTALVSALSGGIYTGQRPDNSVKEDVVINTITLTQDTEPQIGTSNVNIHVPDQEVKIGGVQMKVENRARLNALTALVLTALRAAKITGAKIVVTNQATINEPEIKQHFVNLRIDWSIH